MIEQQNSKCRILIAGCLLVEALALIGVYVASYYTRTRMGMQRYIVYHNNRWEGEMPIEIIKYGLLVLVITLLVGVYLNYQRKAKLNKIEISAMIITLFINIAMVWLLLFYSVEANSAYYLMVVLWLIVMVCQNIVFYCLFLVNKTI